MNEQTAHSYNKQTTTNKNSTKKKRERKRDIVL